MVVTQLPIVFGPNQHFPPLQCALRRKPIFGTRADGGASFALNYPPGGPISAIFVTQADGGASFFFVFLLAGRFQRRFSSILSPIAL